MREPNPEWWMNLWKAWIRQLRHAVSTKLFSQPFFVYTHYALPKLFCCTAPTCFLSRQCFGMRFFLADHFLQGVVYTDCFPYCVQLSHSQDSQMFWVQLKNLLKYLCTSCAVPRGFFIIRGIYTNTIWLWRWVLRLHAQISASSGAV